ncbi:hypothetical protein DIPPA_23320 [Diplonema papillatum]|nr:hypothetical protein DIPPA_23320 [Diplonema papillatum]
MTTQTDKTAPPGVMLLVALTAALATLPLYIKPRSTESEERCEPENQQRRLRNEGARRALAGTGGRADARQHDAPTETPGPAHDKGWTPTRHASQHQGGLQLVTTNPSLNRHLGRNTQHQPATSSLTRKQRRLHRDYDRMLARQRTKQEEDRNR